MESIREFIYEVNGELAAHGAWMAHCYAFEYLAEYYDIIIKYTNNKNELSALYENTVKEYNRISDSPNESFMNPESTERLEKLDDEFLNCFADCVYEIANDFGIEL